MEKHRKPKGEVVATLSLEILSVGGKVVNLNSSEHIALDASFPPVSDRSPSIWQERMTEIGGTLIHLFDPDINGPRRWAYSFLEESDWKRLRIRAEAWIEFKSVVDLAISSSPLGECWIFIDAQWSLKPLIYRRTYAIGSMKKFHDAYGLRMNSAMCVRA